MKPDLPEINQAFKHFLNTKDVDGFVGYCHQYCGEAIVKRLRKKLVDAGLQSENYSEILKILYENTFIYIINKFNDGSLYGPDGSSEGPVQDVLRIADWVGESYVHWRKHSKKELGEPYEGILR